MLFKILTSVAAIVLAMAVGSIFIASAGVDPLAAYSSLFQGAFGSTYSLTEVFVKMSPLLLVSLGYCFCYTMNVIALGGEGQIMIGGLMAAIVSVNLQGWPPVLVILLSMVAAFLGGALWASIPAIMYTKKKLDVVVNCIMSNYIAILLVTFCINGPFQDPTGNNPQSPPIDPMYSLPVLIKGTRLHIGFLIAVALTIIMYYLLCHTPFGIDIKACGLNRTASRYGGIRIEKTILLALLLGGGLAGLAGGFEIQGIHLRVLNKFSANYGWDAVAVTLLGRLHPIGVLFSSFFWAVMKVGANSMQRTVQVPSNLVNVIQGFAIFFILVSEYFDKPEAKQKLYQFRKRQRPGGNVKRREEEVT